MESAITSRRLQLRSQVWNLRGRIVRLLRLPMRGSAQAWAPRPASAKVDSCGIWRDDMRMEVELARPPF